MSLFKTKKLKIAINGFGRIGRAFLKLAWENEKIEIIAVNDLGSIDMLAYLLKHDTAYGTWEHDISYEDSTLIIDGKKIKFLSEKDVTKLPWGELGIDVVVESTGLYTSYEKSQFHIDRGAKAVVITAPSKSDDGSVHGETILMGVNEEKFGTCQITSNASCTTNAASPLIAILDETIGIEKALLNTVHGYTASQVLVDGPSKGTMRETRAAAQNIVPTSTGAAIAVTKAFTKLENKFDGISVRVPVIAGSIVDVTFIAKRNTSKEEVNEILTTASQSDRWKNIFTVTTEPLVSSDILGMEYGSMADLDLTRVVDGNLVKVMAWYDNEMGYTHTLVEHVLRVGEKL